MRTTLPTWFLASALALLTACGGGSAGSDSGGTTSGGTGTTTPKVFPGKFRPLKSASGGIRPLHEVQSSTSPVQSRMQSPRYGHESILLPDGRVLILGGAHRYGDDVTTLLTDIFDPITETFSPGPNLNFHRYELNLAQTPEGILVYGSRNYNSTIDNIPDEFLNFKTMLFEPLPLNEYAAAGIAKGGVSHLLPDMEHILVVGGMKDGRFPDDVNDLPPPYFYNWRSGACYPIHVDKPSDYFRSRQAVTVKLMDNRIMILGGVTGYKTVQTSPNSWITEEYPATHGLIFNNENKSFAKTSDHKMMRNGHTVLLLADGKVGIYGGTGDGYKADYINNSVEIYDPESNSFSSTKPTGINQAAHESILLPSGLTLHTGGQKQTDGTNFMSVLAHDHVQQESGFTGAMVENAILKSMIRMNNGKVLVTGGEDGYGKILDTAEIFEPEGPISISYSTDAILTDSQLNFQCNANFEIDWTCTSGSITQNGTFTAPSYSGDVWDRASKRGDASIFAQGIIHVQDAAPTNLIYSNNPAIYTLNQAISPNVPTWIGSKSVRFSVTPSLPTGLTIDEKSGIIMGTPTTIQPSTTYKIHIENSAGIFVMDLQIEVK